MTTTTTTYSNSFIYSCLCKAGLSVCFVRVLLGQLSRSWYHRRLCIVNYALCIIAMLLANACGHDELVPPDVYEEEPPLPYVEIRIAIPIANPPSTRANPMGGEEGNGRERGILDEDKIHNINVFFYDDRKYGANGMDSDGDAPVVYYIYYNLDRADDPNNSKLSVTTENENDQKFESQYLKLRFVYKREDIPNADGLKILAIANVGELPWENLKTLGAIRDLDLTSNSSFSSWISDDVFSKNAKNMKFFLMSTAYNTNNTFSGQLTGTNTLSLVNGEYTGSTTLQRMYARLDLWYSADANAGSITDSDTNIDELVYPVNNANGNIVYLTNVLAVNVKKTPSYVFKKVTSGYSGPWTRDYLKSLSSFSWGGKESPEDGPYAGSSYNDQPQNYVMEPYTLFKNKDGSVGDFKNADGNYGGLKDWYGNTALSVVKTQIKDPTKGKFSDYYHMTRSKGSYDPDYGCDHISIISYANENTHPTDCFHSNYLTGMAFRAVYVPQTIYGAYEQTTDDDGKTEWQLKEMEGTPTEIYRYSPTTKEQAETNSLYFTDKDEAEKYAVAHPEDMAIISGPFTAEEHDGKWGFVCYYNLWLRHYNNEAGDPTENYPMEYATVRNNIYRVSVSFSGPGDPTPTMREPDTMKARIFVRKWNYREEDALEFD